MKHAGGSQINGGQRKERESILSLSINFKKRRESIWNGHRGKTIPENEKRGVLVIVSFAILSVMIS